MIAITTQYKPATETRGSRIVATTENGHKLSVSTGHTSIDNLDVADKHRFVAEKLFKEQIRQSDGDKFELVAGGIKGGYAFVIIEKRTQEVAR